MNLVKKFQLIAFSVLAFASASVFAKKSVVKNHVNDVEISELENHLETLTRAQEKMFATFNKVDQPFAIFKSNGGKYSWMQFCSPAYNQCNMMLCTPKLNDLKPLRLFEKWADGGKGLQRDRKFQGYREPYIAQAFEAIFNALGLLTDTQYKGTVLVDEYNQGLPQKWVIRYSDVKPLISYLTGKLPSEVTDETQKPFLLLKLQGKGTLEDADLAFFEKYYNMLDEQDPAVIKFFDAANKTLSDLEQNTTDAKIVMDTMGDSFLRDLEGKTKEFDLKKLAVYFTGIVTTALVVKYLSGPVSDMFNEKVLGKKPAPKLATKEQIDELINVLRQAHNIPRPAAAAAVAP